MARKNSTFLNDIFHIFSKLPWWLGIILAPLSYFFINSYAVIPVLDIKQPIQHLPDTIIFYLASVGRYVIPTVILLGSLKSIFSSLKRINLIKNVRNKSNLETSKTLASISWVEFEMLVGQYFKELGYKVVETGGRADGGVDLRLRKSTGELFLVQCKHWKTSKVPVNVVREIFGVMQAEHASGAFVVTSGKFTADAENFARGKSIELLDGERLINSLNQPQTTVNKPQNIDSILNPPLCPICNSAMIMRTAKRGANAGNAFFGCSRFPSCKGVQSL